MQVAFHRPDDEDKTTVATATWDGRDVSIDSEDEALGAALRKAFRSSAVVVDDPSLLPAGTHGEVLVNPGTLEWFRAVAHVRAAKEVGVAARFIPGVTEGGYDPAAAYRSFDESIERLTTGARD